MDRRGMLATLGVVLSGGCLDATQFSSGSPPTEFDRPAYADGFTSHGPWEASRRDSAGSGHNPTSRLPTGDVDTAWHRSVEGSIDPRTGPVTDGRHIYVGHQHSTDNGQQGIVTAFKGETGIREWTTVLELPDASDTSGDDTRTWDAVGGLARHGETIYVTGHSRHYEVVLLAALDGASGTVDWQVSVPGTEYRAPVTDSSGVYLPFGRDVSSADEPAVNALYAFSHGGTERWSHRFGNRIPARNACVADGVVYAGLDDGRLLAFESASGTLQWVRTIEIGPADSSRDERDGHLAAADERLFVLTGDGRLATLSSADGSTLWTRDFAVTAPPRPPPSLVCRAETIYVGAGDVLVAIDAADGTDRWRVDGVPVGCSLVGVADGLVGAAGSTVAGFDFDGQKRWSVELGQDRTDATDELDPRAISAHDMVYLGSSDGRVYAIGARSSPE